MPKENKHYACIACVNIDSVMRIDKKNYPRVYIEGCKYKTKKAQISGFNSTKLDSDSESDNDPGNDSDNDSDK